VPAKYLTFLIRAGSKNGRLIVTGPFDHAYGFSVSVDWKVLCVFAADGIALTKGEKGNAEFAISIKELSANYQFNIKFEKPESTAFTLQQTGEISLGGISIVDAPVKLE
jgi:hypothetical protein